MLSVEIKILGKDLGLEKDVENLQERLANQIPIEARRIIDESNPSGRVYRRNAITARRTKALENLGLKRRGKTRIITGYTFHRASARGQAPAKDSGKLYQNIRVSRTGRGKFRVIFGTPYAGILEFTLDRPFVLPAIQAAVEKVFNE